MSAPRTENDLSELDSTLDALSGAYLLELERIRRQALAYTRDHPATIVLPYRHQLDAAARSHAAAGYLLGCATASDWAISTAPEGQANRRIDALTAVLAAYLLARWLGAGRRPRIGARPVPREVVSSVAGAQSRMRVPSIYGLQIEAEAAAAAARFSDTLLTGVRQELGEEGPGQAAIAAREIERMTRYAETQTLSVVNGGILGETWEDEWVVGWRYLATLDSRTSDFCRHIHGRYTSKATMRSVGMGMPPFHPWCRTIVVPVFRWEVPPEEMDWTLPRRETVGGREVLIDVARLRDPNRPGERVVMGAAGF
ncbi:MAG: hypothetical protein GF320_11345 [Armatimonadia bacterium]|nr:hypothetical protein [Armatimonadia bacterium]